MIYIDMNNQGKIKIKLEIRKNPDSTNSKFMMIFLGPGAKKIRDLVIKVKLLCPRILDSDEVEVYQDKYLLPHDEDIELINTQEDVIIVPISSNNSPRKRPKHKVRSIEMVPAHYIDTIDEDEGFSTIM